MPNNSSRIFTAKADPAESKIFERHLNDCVACRSELAAFGDVRRAVGDWREAALGITPLLAHAEAAPVADKRAMSVAPRRSALAAVREFFALSPLWLRAASVAAVGLFCMLVALTVARTEVQWDANGIALRTGVEQRIVERRVEVPVSVGVPQEEVDQLSAGYRRELDELRSRLQQNEEAAFEVANMSTPAPRRAASTPNITPRQSRAATTTPVAAPRRAPRVNIAGSDDDDIPRLYDLLGEGR